jgi:hypothetical protein
LGPSDHTVARATALAFLAVAVVACGGSSGTEAAATTDAFESDAARKPGRNRPPAPAPAPEPAPAPAPAPEPAPSQPPSPPPSPAPSPSAAWRPFNDASPWNTPIASNATAHANSAALIEAFIGSTPFGAHLDINYPVYSVPLYWASASTPMVPVKAAVGGEGWRGWPATADMPIPPGATPDPESDHHLLAISPDRKTEYGCFNMRYSAGSSPAWQADLCATADLTGSGVRTPAASANPWYLAHGPRACGFPLVAGLIRVEEVQAGAIEHALVIAYPGLMKDRYMSPASTPSVIGVPTSATGMPCGARVQLDPGVDVTALGLSPAGVMVARALQKYGAYVGDYSGALSVYAENSAEAQAYWRNGVLDVYELRDKLDLRKLRVLPYGTVY